MQLPLLALFQHQALAVQVPHRALRSGMAAVSRLHDATVDGLLYPLPPLGLVLIHALPAHQKHPHCALAPREAHLRRLQMQPRSHALVLGQPLAPRREQFG